MKLRVLLLVVMVTLTASCTSNLSCPTYDTVRARSDSRVQFKKARSVDQTPYYKTVRMAERD